MVNFLLHVVVTLGHTIPFALGYNLVFGKGKIFHFGPIGTSVVAAYGIYATWYHTGSITAGIAVGLTLTVFLAVFFAWLALRLEPDGLGVMTIAVHLAALSVVLNWQSLTRGALGIPRIERFVFLESLPAFAFVASVGIAFWILLYFWIDRSAFGRKLQALAEHNWHASALGIRRFQVYMIAFIILGITQVWTNLIFPQYIHLLTPNDYQFPSFIFVVMIVVAGGAGNARGVLLSSVLLVCLKEGIRFLPLAPAILGPVRLILFGVILFVAVWIRRDTLFPKQRTV